MHYDLDNGGCGTDTVIRTTSEGLSDIQLHLLRVAEGRSPKRARVKVHAQRQSAENRCVGQNCQRRFRKGNSARFSFNCTQHGDGQPGACSSTQESDIACFRTLEKWRLIIEQRQRTIGNSCPNKQHNGSPQFR